MASTLRNKKRRLFQRNDETLHPPCKRRKVDLYSLLKDNEANYDKLITSTCLDNKASSSILFTVNDMSNLGLRTNGQVCSICNKSFSKPKGYLGHIATSKQHQVNIVKFILTSRSDFPPHIKARASTKSICATASKQSIINMFKKIERDNLSQSSNAASTVSSNNGSSFLDSNASSHASLFPISDTRGLDISECEEDDEFIINYDEFTDAPPTNNDDNNNNNHNNHNDNTAYDSVGLSRCNHGMMVKNILYNVTPHVMRKYDLKIIDNELHHKSCNYYNVVTSPCSVFFTTSTKTSIRKKLQYAAKHTHLHLSSRTEIKHRYRNQGKLIKSLKLQQLNPKRNIISLQNQNRRYEQLKQTLSTHDVPRMMILMKNHFAEGRSIESLCVRIKDIATRQQRTVKSYTEFDYQLGTFLLSLPRGPTILYTLNQLGLVTSSHTARTKIKQFDFPLITKWISETQITDTMNNVTSSLGAQPRGLSLDFVYMNERIEWDPATNKLAGFCMEHYMDFLPDHLEKEQDAVLLRKCYDSGIIHKAQRIMIPISYGLSLFDKNYSIDLKLLPAIPSCAIYSGKRWYDIFTTLIMTLNKKETVDKYGPTFVLSTDCEQVFEPIFKLIRQKHGITLIGFSAMTNRFLYDRTLCGVCTEDKDCKHFTKKFRNVLINNSIKIFKHIITPENVSDILICGDVPDAKANYLLNEADEQNVSAAFELLHKLQSLLHGDKMKKVLTKLQLKYNSIQYNALKKVLPELQLFVNAGCDIIDGMFKKKINLTDRLKLITEGSIILKVLYVISKHDIFLKDTMKAIIIHCHAMYHIIYQMQRQQQFSRLDLLALYIGSDLSETAHTLLRSCCGLYHCLSHLIVQQRLKFLQSQINFASKYPHLTKRHKRNKLSGDDVNIASYDSDLNVFNVNLYAVLFDARISAKARIIEIVDYEDDIIETIDYILNKPLYMLPISSTNVKNLTNVFEFEEKACEDYVKTLDLYEDNLKLFMVNHTDSTQMQILKNLMKRQQPTRNNNDNNLIINDNQSEFDIDLTNQDDIKAMDELSCGLEEANKPFSKFISFSRSEKIHKITFIKSIFDKNNRYYVDRILRCRQVLKQCVKKDIPISIPENNNMVLLGDIGLTLVQCGKSSYVSLTKIVGISFHKQKVHRIPFNSLNDDDQDIIFQCILATNIVSDCDDDNKLKWFGNTLHTKYRVDYRCILFPSFNSDLHNPQCIICTNTQELQNAATILLSSKHTVKYIQINDSTRKAAELPYNTELKYNKKCNVQTQYIKTKKTSKTKEKSSETKLTPYSLLVCNNCDEDENTFSLDVIVVHQMKHELDSQVRQNRGPIDNRALVICYFCGKKSLNQCNLKCATQRGRQQTRIISADCLKGSIGGRFYYKLANVTKTTPWSNYPTVCVLCGEMLWRYNMWRHFEYKHPDQVLPEAFIISAFELKCVEYVGEKTGYIKDDYYKKLKVDFPDETVALLGDREKDKLKRQTKYRNSKKKKKINIKNKR